MDYSHDPLCLASALGFEGCMVSVTAAPFCICSKPQHFVRGWLFPTCTVPASCGCDRAGAHRWPPLQTVLGQDLQAELLALLPLTGMHSRRVRCAVRDLGVSFHLLRVNMLYTRSLVLNEHFSLGTIVMLSAGLFERHKLLFSFNMTIKIEQAEGKVPQDELDFFLKGNRFAFLRFPSSLDPAGLCVSL